MGVLGGRDVLHRDSWHRPLNLGTVACSAFTILVRSLPDLQSGTRKTLPCRQPMGGPTTARRPAYALFTCRSRLSLPAMARVLQLTVLNLARPRVISVIQLSSANAAHAAAAHVVARTGHRSTALDSVVGRRGCLQPRLPWWGLPEQPLSESPAFRELAPQQVRMLISCSTDVDNTAQPAVTSFHRARGRWVGLCWGRRDLNVGRWFFRGGPPWKACRQ